MPFEDREREGNPPEYPLVFCAWCADEIGVHSQSDTWCDECRDKIVREQRRRELKEEATNELNATLAGIGGRL